MCFFQTVDDKSCNYEAQVSGPMSKVRPGQLPNPHRSNLMLQQGQVNSLIPNVQDPVTQPADEPNLNSQSKKRLLRSTPEPPLVRRPLDPNADPEPSRKRVRKPPVPESQLSTIAPPGFTPHPNGNDNSVFQSPSISPLHNSSIPPSPNQGCNGCTESLLFGEDSANKFFIYVSDCVNIWPDKTDFDFKFKMSNFYDSMMKWGADFSKNIDRTLITWLSKLDEKLERSIIESVNCITKNIQAPNLVTQPVQIPGLAPQPAPSPPPKLPLDASGTKSVSDLLDLCAMNEDVRSQKRFVDDRYSIFVSGKKPSSTYWKNFEPTHERFGKFDGKLMDNNILDCKLAEDKLGITGKGSNTVDIWTKSGKLISKGFERIVPSDHGPYFEIALDSVIWKNTHFSKGSFPKSKRPYFVKAFADRMTLYLQVRTVADRPNPPSGILSFRNDRRTGGYADYRPGMVYVSCLQVRTAAGIMGKVRPHRSLFLGRDRIPLAKPRSSIQTSRTRSRQKPSFQHRRLPLCRDRMFPLQQEPPPPYQMQSHPNVTFQHRGRSYQPLYTAQQLCQPVHCQQVPFQHPGARHSHPNVSQGGSPSLHQGQPLCHPCVFPGKPQLYFLAGSPA